MMGTKQVAALLGIRPNTFIRAIWEGRIPPPTKGLGGAYLWTRRDIEQASWVLRRRNADDVLSPKKVTDGHASDSLPLRGVCNQKGARVLPAEGE